MNDEEQKQHISYSELLTFDKCQYKHNLIYVQKAPRSDNVYSVFGSALHESIDTKYREKCQHPWISMGKTIVKYIKLEKPELDYKEWVKSGFRIYSEIFNFLKENFGNYELIGSEIDLYEALPGEEELKFKGFIDLVIKDEKGIYHVIDFKTCSWGWNKEKRNDTKKKYQIRLYKKFVCDKLGLDPDKVKAHFVLMKRTPPKKGGAIELFTITAGKKSQENAMDWTAKKLKGIKKGKKLKNRMACKWCEYKGNLCK